MAADNPAPDPREVIADLRMEAAWAGSHGKNPRREAFFTRVADTLAAVLDERDRMRSQFDKAERKVRSQAQDIAVLCSAVNVVYRGDDEATLDKVLALKAKIQGQQDLDIAGMHEVFLGRLKEIKVAKTSRKLHPDDPGYSHPLDGIRELMQREKERGDHAG